MERAAEHVAVALTELGSHIHHFYGCEPTPVVIALTPASCEPVGQAEKGHAPSECTVVGLHVRRRAAQQYGGAHRLSQPQGNCSGVVAWNGIVLLVSPLVFFI